MPQQKPGVDEILGFSADRIYSRLSCSSALGISRRSAKNTILLRLYLKQAIILRGHHQDLKNGPEMLDDSARFINGLGNVEWSNMRDLCRANFQLSTNGMEAQVKPLGRKLSCSLPTEVKKVLIDSSSSECWKIRGQNGSEVSARSGNLFYCRILRTAHFLLKLPPICRRRWRRYHNEPRSPPLFDDFHEGRDRFISR